jgi:hypothetical protein
MAWVELFVVFLVCHVVGDFILQTDWQATHKRGGLGGDPTARRALFSHVTVYTLSFLPAFVWIASERSVGWAVLTAVLIFIPHLIQDDGRLIRLYAARVKKVQGDNEILFLMLDQSFHMVALFLLALWIGY